MLWALLEGNFGLGGFGSRVKPGMTVLWLAVMAVGLAPLRHPGLRAGPQSQRAGVLLVGKFGLGGSGSRGKPGMAVLWLAVMAVGPAPLRHPGLRAGVQSHYAGFCSVGNFGLGGSGSRDDGVVVSGDGGWACTAPSPRPPSRGGEAGEAVYRISSLNRSTNAATAWPRWLSRFFSSGESSAAVLSSAAT